MNYGLHFIYFTFILPLCAREAPASLRKFVLKDSGSEQTLQEIFPAESHHLELFPAV